jgi:lipoprotein NlpI
MRLLAAAFSALTILLIAGAAQAASRSDWNDCESNDSDRTIRGCTRVLQDRGESARNRATAYYNRGLAYLEKDDPDRALADFNEAIRLNPKNDYYVVRCEAYAIADYNEAVRLEPKNSRGYALRGIGYLFAGSLDKALSDLNQASELDPKDTFAALWLDIVSRRNKLPSRLAEAVAKLDMTVWPGPVVRLFLGQLTPAAVLAAADDANPVKKKNQLCEANFFLGELALLQGANEEATRLFRLAANECPRYYYEWDDAHAEALGAQR